MSKLGKLEEMRYAGARWLLEKIEKDGLEKAVEEMHWRGVQNAPLCIEKAEILRFEHDLRENCKRTMCALTCLCLHDQFGLEETGIDTDLPEDYISTGKHK